MDKDKLQLLLKKMMKRADLVTIGLFLLLLLITGYVFLTEQQADFPAPDPPPTLDWNRKIPSDEYTRVKSKYMVANPDIKADPDAGRITQNNMFDIKSVRSATELARQASAELQEADKLYRAGDLAGALTKVDAILLRNPDHTPSLELKKAIEEAIAKAAATPTPAPPA